MRGKPWRAALGWISTRKNILMRSTARNPLMLAAGANQNQALSVLEMHLQTAIVGCNAGLRRDTALSRIRASVGFSESGPGVVLPRSRFPAIVSEAVRRSNRSGRPLAQVAHAAVPFRQRRRAIGPGLST